MGYKPEAITDIILTHLHYDHCGGSIKRNARGEFELTFPNATIHISKNQWESAINPNPREADSFLRENIIPIEELGALNLVEKEGFSCRAIENQVFQRAAHQRADYTPYPLPTCRVMVYAADLFPSTAHIHPI